jgi:hypothetical protein
LPAAFLDTPDMSKYPSEKEVLFASSTAFTIRSVQSTQGGKGSLELVVEPPIPESVASLAPRPPKEGHPLPLPRAVPVAVLPAAAPPQQNYSAQPQYPEQCVPPYAAPPLQYSANSRRRRRGRTGSDCP